MNRKRLSLHKFQNPLGVVIG